MINVVRRCGLEGELICEYKKENHIPKWINVCCNFCTAKQCDKRCLNSWEKCGLMTVEMK